MTNMIASIIVPIFNIENYINQCIDSLLPLLKHHCEIIMVAGNSTDNTNKLAQQYVESYASVCLVWQNGRGLSNARNTGLRTATGEWIVFIDGDDFIDSAVLIKILEDMQPETDILMTNFYRNYEKNASQCVINDIKRNDLNGLEDLSSAIRVHKCFWNVWRNIYRRKFLKEHSLLFQENTYAEDIDYFSRVCLSKPRLKYRTEAFYHYRMDRNGSLMNEIPITRLQQTADVIEKSIQKLRNASGSWVADIISGFQFEYILNMVFVCEYSKEQRKQATQIFSSSREVLLPTSDFAVRWITHGVDILGAVGFSRLLWLMKRFKRKLENRNV